MNSALKTYLRLLAGTALTSVLFHSGTVHAACSSNNPSTPGQVVTCTGNDTTGITSATMFVSVNIESGASITTTGNAITMGGFGSFIDIDGNVTSTTGTAIRLNNGGNVWINTTGVVSGGISTTGDFSAIYLMGTVDNINLGWPGSQVMFHETASFSGIINGNSMSDFNLMNGSATAVFDTDQIGTTILGFDLFNKTGTADTWTLSGTNKQDWRVMSGNIIGTTDNIGNITTFGPGGTVGINQSYNGTYTGTMGGAVNAHISGGGDITFQNANTYVGITEVSGLGTKLIVSADNRLGNATNGITLRDGGGLELSSSFNITRDITLSNGQGFIYTPGTNTTLSGNISGTGTLVFSGAGTTTISGTKTYQGGTAIIGDATLRVSTDDNLGDAVGNLALDDGTLQWDAAFDTARNIGVGGGGATLNHQSFDIVLSGNLSGAGLLTKTGSGNMVLTGTSAKTGGFAVTGGTLTGDTGNLSGGNIANDGTVVFDQTSNGTFSSAITGAGSFVKQGAGNLILSGTNSYSGTTLVSDGRLSVNGSLTNSDTTVSSGAIIGGNGTIQGLDLSGTLAPGNSIGTLNAGNTVFQTGSVYEVEVNNALQSDLINITGTLDIDSGATVSVLAAPGAYAANNLYTIITHTGARTGIFGTVTSDLAFLTPSLVYNANDVQLLLTNNNVSFDSIAKDHVQKDVAQNIEQLGSGNAVYDAFSGLTVADAQKALDDASGEHFAGLTGAATESIGIIRNVLSSRLQTLVTSKTLSSAGQTLALGASNIISAYNAFDVEPAAGDKNLRNANSRVWVEAFGMTGKSDAKGTATRQDRDTAGTVGGMDTKINDDTVVGAFVGYETGAVKSKTERATSDVNNYHAGIYSTYDLGHGFNISGGAGGTYHDIESKRRVVFGGLDETPVSDTDGYTATVFIEGSHLMELSNDSAIEPFIGLNATYTYINGYTEKEGGALNLKVDDMKSVTPSHVVGVRAGTLLINNEDVHFNMNGSVAWQHSYGNLKDDAQINFVSGSSSGFTTYGPGRARDAALVNLGFDAVMGESTMFYSGYSGMLSKDAQDHILKLGINYKF